MKTENNLFLCLFVLPLDTLGRYISVLETAITNMLKTTPFRFALVAVFLTIIGSALADDDGK